MQYWLRSVSRFYPSVIGSYRILGVVIIQRLRVRNFQSLRALDLELGKFTVIVGPSSSGKTALVRALRALTTNSITAQHTSHGAKSSSVAVELPGAAVEVTRSGATVAYSVMQAGQDTQTFTKLSGAVPEAVEGLLGVGGQGLAPGLCVAGQFDRPYLLDEAGAKVAQALGELTNVSIIFDAAREANRRKLATNHMLRTRETDLANLIQQVAVFKGLPDRIKACAKAEDYVRQGQELETRATRLSALLASFEVSQAALQALPSDTQVPDYAPIEQAYSKLSRFKALIYEVSTYHASVLAARKAEEESLALTVELEEQLHNTLQAAGVCPFCGSEIK